MRKNNIGINQERVKLYKPIMTLTFHTEDFSSSINHVVGNLIEKDKNWHEIVGSDSVKDLLLGCLCCPVINSVFGRLWRKTASRGREDTRVWTEKRMVSYDFSLHGALHGYFLYLISAPPEKPTRRCEPEEGYLRCSKRFDHRSHSIIFLLFEFKSVRWCWRWETQRNAHVAYKPTRRSR